MPDKPPPGIRKADDLLKKLVQVDKADAPKPAKRKKRRKRKKR